MTTTKHQITTHPIYECGCPGRYEFPLSCSCGWEHTASTVSEAGHAIDRHYRTRNAAQ